ncbi:RNase H family protein [Agrobacterium sp. DSM 25558]|nr:RNase H family protein [Agrobacterium sp. DSM 25558]
MNLATEIPDLDEARQQALNPEPGRMDIYVDGSYDAGSGKGGWAFVVMSAEETLATGSGRFDGATNNALELVAAL